MIYNKNEYKNFIRQLYTNSATEEFENFESELINSDKKRRQLQQQLRNLTSELQKESDEKKKSILSKKLETLRKQKSMTLSTNDFRISRFAMLSLEAKKYACTSALLNKYLTGEIIKNNPLSFETVESGDIIIDFDKMKDSYLHELAIDIRDFVSFYFENDGDKIKTANHFLDIYKNVETIYELNRCIDRYYDKTRKDLDEYTVSQTDVIQIQQFPKEHIQLMRITGPEGLNYESDKMGHCIRRNRYVEKLQTTAEYYSFRNMKRRQANYPYVTAYFNEGNLIEVVGKSNHAIASLPLVKIVRNFIKEKLNLTSDDELLTSDKIPETAKRNMGIVKDKDEVFRDLYNIQNEELHFSTLPITAHNINKIKMQKIHANRIWLQGNYTPKLVDQLNRLASMNELNISVKFNFDDITELDLSNLKVKKLDISKINLRNITKITFPDTLEHLEANTIDFSKISRLDFRNCKNLHTLSMRNSDLRQTNTILFNKKIKDLDIEYAKMSKPLQNKLTHTKNILSRCKNFFIVMFNKNFKRNKK